VLRYTVLRGVPARLTRRAGRRVKRCERGEPPAERREKGFCSSYLWRLL
jgi:hypothetical protein